MKLQAHARNRMLHHRDTSGDSGWEEMHATSRMVCVLCNLNEQSIGVDSRIRLVKMSD